MKLLDLDPELIRWEDRVPTDEEAARSGIVRPNPAVATTFLPQVHTLAEAQGVEFDCPRCSDGHRIQVAFRERGVLDHQATRDREGNPTRWAVSGTGLEDLTLQPSVDCTQSNPKCWHGSITNGEVS